MPLTFQDQPEHRRMGKDSHFRYAGNYRYDSGTGLWRVVSDIDPMPSGVYWWNGAAWVDTSIPDPLPVQIPASASSSFTELARANGLLQAAGAWDPAPTQIDPQGEMYASVVVRYQRNANGGGYDLWLEKAEEDIENPGTYLWSTVVLLDRSAGIVAGAQTVVPGQSEIYRYAEEGGTDEIRHYDFKIFRPAFVRVNFREPGAEANPGNLQATIRFSSE